MGDDYTFGTARWDKHAWIPLEREDEPFRLIFGHPLHHDETADPNRGEYVSFAPFRHFLSVAPTRTGKGTSLIIPNLLNYAGPCIVIDPKGENAWITAKYRREELGQRVVILDPWNEVNRRYGDLVGEQEKIFRYNPLSILDPKSAHYADDLAYIADALIINQGKDPHWDDSARELVAGLIAFCVETYGDKATLPMVRLLLSKPADEVAGLAAEAQKLGFESVAARKLGRFARDNKETASIISTALTQTAFLDSMTLGENLSASDFSFDELTANYGTTIYLVLPVDKLQTYGRWLRLLVSIGIRTIARNTKKLRLPILFFLDEFGTIGRLSAVAQAYGLMAGLQMCIWAFVQDFVQLRRDYPDDWETFIGNSQAVSACGLMDQMTCRYISDMLGRRTLERISQATAEQRQGGFFKPGDPDYMSMQDQLYSRELMQASELRRFPPPYGIVIRRGGAPVQVHQINYHEDKKFFARARPNPLFPESMKRHAAILAEADAQKKEKACPDFPAAVKLLEDRGIKVAKQGLLKKTVAATFPNGETKTFDTESLFVSWVRDNEL